MKRSNTFFHRTGVVMFMILTTNGCGGRERGGSTSFQARDSAGIRIVVSTGPAWAVGEEWSLDTASEVVMGEGDAEEGLLWRVTGVTRLSDGRVAVLDAGSGQMKYFSSLGRLLHASGGIGGGPGEFQYPLAFSRGSGDTLIVLDRDGRRVFFDPQGQLVRELPFQRATPDPENPVYFTFDAPLPDGTILGRERPQESSRSLGTGWFRPTIHITRKNSASETVAEFGTYGEIQQERIDLGERRGSIVPPFARTTSFSLGGDNPRVVVGDNDQFELRVFDLEGTLLQLVRRAYVPPTVTGAEVEAWKDRQRNSSWVEGQLPQLERGWAQMRVPKTKPAFGMRFGTSTHGYLWVAEYTGAPIKPRLLHIFDPQGIYLGDLEIPDGLAYSPRTVEIGPDYFLAVFMDEFDVETVRLYSLITPNN